MNHINVTINGRQYRMACEEGQEIRLLKLAESLEQANELMGQSFMDPDFAEGVRSFMERRSPQFAPLVVSSEPAPR